MNNKLRKKKTVSKKAIFFYSAMGVLVIILFTLLIVRVTQSRDVSSYANLEMINGQSMFNQEEDTYYVLFYNFEESKENESFDKGMYQYLTYVRDNAKAVAIYGMDSDNAGNKFCFTTGSEKIDGANQFPNAMNEGEATVLKINEDDLPMLFELKLSDGKYEISSHKHGESEILAYLKDVMND